MTSHQLPNREAGIFRTARKTATEGGTNYRPTEKSGTMTAHAAVRSSPVGPTADARATVRRRETLRRWVNADASAIR